MMPAGTTASAQDATRSMPRSPARPPSSKHFGPRKGEKTGRPAWDTDKRGIREPLAEQGGTYSAASLRTPHEYALSNDGIAPRHWESAAL